MREEDVAAVVPHASKTKKLQKKIEQRGKPKNPPIEAVSGTVVGLVLGP